MWDGIIEFILEAVAELIDANQHREKKKQVTHEKIKEDDIKKL